MIIPRYANITKQSVGIKVGAFDPDILIIRLQVPAAKCRHRSGHTDKRDEEERYGY